MTPRARPQVVELALLAGLAATPWLPMRVAPLVGAPLLWLWWRGLAARRERRTGLAWFGAALALLVAVATISWTAAGGASPPSAALDAAWHAWLEALRADARAGAVAVRSLPTGSARVPAAFEQLERRAASAPRERTFLLLDADGEPVAWSGRGLLHDLAAGSLPEQGIAWRQSATSATVVAVEPVAQPPGGRFVVGESRAREGPAPLAGLSVRGGRWELASDTGAPRLTWLEAPERVPDARGTQAHRLAALLIAFGLLAVASLRGAGRALLAGTVMTPSHSALSVLAQTIAAVVVGALALGSGPAASASLAGAAALAAIGWWLGRTGRLRSRRWLAGAAAGPLVAAAVSWLVAAQFPGAVAAEPILSGAEVTSLRLAMVLVVFGALAVGAAAGTSGAGDLWGWSAAGLAIAGAAVADLPALALPLLAAAGGAAARWVRRESLVAPPALAALWLIAALIAGAAWTCGERRAEIEGAGRAVDRLGPPQRRELDRLALAVRGALESVGRQELPGPEDRLTDTGDLAYALWRRSPLARYDALSALVVESPEHARSTFSWGLPLDAGGRLDLSPARWVELQPASWPDRRISGQGTLAARDGSTWSTRWWLVPRLGFGAQRATDAVPDDLAAGLLRGGASLRRPWGLSRAARWAVWSGDGALIGSSWEEGTPALAGVLRQRAGGEVRTPEGPARFALRRTDDAVAAVFVPRRSPGASLERAGAVAAGGLLPVAALALLAMAAALPRSAVRDLVRRALRSYSKRLLLVYALLLLVPSALLYVFLSGTLERRVENAQEQGARQALRAVQRVLGEYVLTLQPGFGVGTAIDDPLLEWLSRVAQHEVNLYWGSELYASSKRDLFTAGLLSRRLPGEVWVRLALAGDGLARRTTRAGGAEYLELFAPLEVPGQPAGEARLVLSMPLLAQQEEAVAEVARLRRRALLGTLALFCGLAASGTLLARRFTRPIEEIVAGTRRIAGGATELGFRPEEAELEALAEAIDRMAARIAEGREHLLAEKRLVERIIQSVTAGVVALDGTGRVLLANRAARDLLGVEPGESLADGLAGRPELAGVSAWLGSAAAEAVAQTALRLGGGRGEEREWTLVRVPLAEAGSAAALVVVEDVTEVLRAQRLEAWAAMARMIAHEIKNPLTPIRLSAEHLREAWARDRTHFEQVFERCADNILHQVEELREIASEFSVYSRIPRLERQEGDLVAVIREVVEAYRAAPPPGVEIVFAARPEAIPGRFDGRLLARAVRNLIENSVRASAGHGRIEIGVAREEASAVVTVADQGPGVPPDQLPRVLEPYFSTHASGTGLGLPIAARIAEEHGGSLEARNRTTGGFEVVVTIPLG
jgi:signal transduction histidine kinase